MVCPTCGNENPAEARFCLECGSALAGSRCASCETALPPGAKFCLACGAAVQTAEPHAAPAEERRVVSILFVDLVGFTERSDQADPEDVRRTLIPFHERVKEDLERFGGTLDKFIGDAVMGVFGAPVAHEDDPLRAVRSALSILRSMEELRHDDPDLAVRIAVNTGEAVVSFGSGPQVGEAVAGDVVNTASRMQGLAPRGAVVIGESTLRSVRAAFDVELLPAATVKGKAEPLTVWRVLGERASIAADVAPTTFVGRDQELALLRGLFDRTVGSTSLQLVTLIAEPGIGKTRLVEEFRRRLDGRARWLSGHSLPYGEDVTFAPIAEIVRAEAGFDQAIAAREAEERLTALADRVERNGAERDWLKSRLRPVLGLAHGGPQETIPARETAQAWARIVLHAAAGDPVVIELGDLHWADDVLIEAIEGLGDALARAPVLLLCTARPEFLERHGGWGTGRTNATTIGLERLNAAETGRLLTELLAQVVLPAASRDSLLERAGGNPLYALEFARMLSEHVRGDASEEIAVPESVQAVIAARLDAIPSELRSLVLDASVVGPSCWPGALAELGDRDPSVVREDAEALVRRGVFEPSGTSTFEGEPEYLFTHALIREVAYGRIPRAQRARRHLAAGSWIERRSGERSEERAEILATHFATAAELGEAAHEEGVVESALPHALRWSMTAAKRAGRLDAAGAFALSNRAARLAPEGSRERAEALSLSAVMGRRSNAIEGREVLRRYEESLEISRTLGDRLATGSALTRLGSQAGALGDMARSHDLLAEAVGVLEAEPPGKELAGAYAYRAEEGMFAGRVDEAMEFAGRALDLVAGTDADDIAIMALHIRGDARCAEGADGGLADLREALRIARSIGDAAGIALSENYLAEWTWATEGPAAGIAHYEAALEITERRGLVVANLWAKGGSLGALFDSGDWDRALRFCEEMLAVGRERLDGSLDAVARIMRSRIGVRRGHRDLAEGAEDLLAAAHPLEELQVMAPALVTSAEIALAHGAVVDASSYLKEFEEVTRDVAAQYRESQLAEAARLCVRAGEVPLAEQLASESRGVVPRDRLNVLSARAVVAEATGNGKLGGELYAEASEGWRKFRNPLEEAEALLGLARCSPGDSVAGEEHRHRASELLANLRVPAP
jgi:class 3 adenylate cyclase/tetratricopeptide (TPR) repeat protein